MPGVFLNLSFTTSPVTSATYSEQGVTVPAVRESAKKGTAAAGTYCTCQFHKMKMRMLYSVHGVLSYFFHSLLLSLNFSVWVAYSPFSSSIYFFFWDFVLSCHTDRYTKIRIRVPNQQLWYLSRQGSNDNAFYRVSCDLLHEVGASIHTWGGRCNFL